MPLVTAKKRPRGRATAAQNRIWERSQSWQRLRRVQNWGAFWKWKFENPEEHARVTARWKQEAS